VSVVVSAGAGRLGIARGLLKISTIFWLGCNREQLYDQTVLGQLSLLTSRLEVQLRLSTRVR